jgi:IPT/TIG domain-containing protein
VDFTINCLCGCPGAAPAGGQGLIVVTGGDYSAWQAAAPRITNVSCPSCGCTQNPVDSGSGSIIGSDTGRPRIDSISVVTGPVAGGTSVTLTGHRLNTAGLTVSFGGVPGTGLTAQSSRNCTITTPPGNPTLVTQGAVTGNLSPGNVITGASSGNTATIVSIAAGLLVVSSPTGHFQAGEWVQKDVNNKIQLANSNQFNGVVTVTVTNANGQRTTGGSLLNGFTYV